MDKVWWWIMDVILPVVLLIALVWLVFRRSRRTDRTTYEGTKANYAEEEARRREGTDDL